ncbi:hypothetical protein [Paludibaculum fermentans]|uniref:hypothetical protein n=1 Tax=Paludibaculum fermentans TaxID=1473598 RepID=UPI003EBBA4C3
MSARRLIFVFTAVQALLGMLAEAAPPLTQIYDTLYKADGTPFTGSAVVSWRSFTAADTSNIPANSLTLQVVGGLLRVKLVPTTNASANAYYTVRFNVDGKLQFTEIWSVPPSNLAVAVKDVRVQAPAGSNAVAAAASVVQLVDVVGLTEALADRPTKSIAFQPNRIALIDATGEIAGVSGSPGDCVHVDGTAGTCGAGGGAIGFVDMETPAGSVDGANAVFVLAQAPFPAGSLHLFRNGILQKPALDYVLSGNRVTFLSVATPQTGDLLLASYRTAGP